MRRMLKSKAIRCKKCHSLIDEIEIYTDFYYCDCCKKTYDMAEGEEAACAAVELKTTRHSSKLLDQQ